MKKSLLLTLIIIAVLILDQWIKVWVKLSVPYGDGFNILGLEWAQIHFIENKGMAFGLEFGGIAGKYVLSIFRIVMVVALVYMLRSLIKAKESIWLLVSFALIIAGAIGNIIDSMFYGLIFSRSIHGHLAEFMPEAGGYAPFLQGRVVDMFHFPLIDTHWPEWFPFWGGQRLEFFRPVFNLADSAISVGVVSILLFHRKIFTQKKEDEKVEISKPNSESTSPSIASSSSEEE